VTQILHRLFLNRNGIFERPRQTSKRTNERTTPQAVSNSCGSQIINIFIGLGLPWSLANFVTGLLHAAEYSIEVGIGIKFHI